ncbi:hypothetical protein ES706_01308 [subsurface metagenome]|nr:hypothetical protein [Dehalococcoidia bacterium]
MIKIKKVGLGIIAVIVVLVGLWMYHAHGLYEKSYRSEYHYGIRIQPDSVLHNITLFVPLPVFEEESKIGDEIIVGNYFIMGGKFSKPDDWDCRIVETEHGKMLKINAEKIAPEFHSLPVPIEDAAEQIVIAKWMLRMMGYKYGVTISFAPKILVGHAGSGLHIHTRLVRNGKNMMIEGSGLSSIAKKAIAGYLALAPSLTAFGNTIPTSYLRLVSHQEAPTNICWGDRNRSVLVRVPLGWINVKNMARDANPQERTESSGFIDRQTVEFRCPDGSANIYLLLAGLAVAARHGLEMRGALEVANKFYVDINIFSSEHKGIQEKLPQLPASCWESAKSLLRDREIYQRNGVFSSTVIDGIVKKLKSYNDKDLSEKLYGREDEIKKLLDE